MNHLKFDIRCEDCGKFVSTRDFITYIPYGNAYDTEPPEERYLCRQCYEKSPPRKDACWYLSDARDGGRQ